MVVRLLRSTDKILYEDKEIPREFLHITTFETALHFNSSAFDIHSIAWQIGCTDIIKYYYLCIRSKTDFRNRLNFLRNRLNMTLST